MGLTNFDLAAYGTPNREDEQKVKTDRLMLATLITNMKAGVKTEDLLKYLNGE